MAHLRWLDLSIVFAYLLALTSTGLWFSRKQTTTERYFMAKRSIPAWAMGMSVVATLITSITFVSYPGSAYSKDWSLLVPAFMVVAVLALVGAVIIPFYGQTVGMSAYEYFGKRFGLPTRVYSSIAFALDHFSKMGFVFYLLALTINSITGWDMDEVIVIAGALTIVYTLKGGLDFWIRFPDPGDFVIWVIPQYFDLSFRMGIAGAEKAEPDAVLRSRPASGCRKGRRTESPSVHTGHCILTPEASLVPRTFRKNVPRSFVIVWECNHETRLYVDHSGAFRSCCSRATRRQRRIRSVQSRHPPNPLRQMLHLPRSG
jgi:hypothetical protein